VPESAQSRWSLEQVLALAPDPAAAKAGRGLGTPKPWRETGSAGPLVWGLCQGSGANPYQTCVDLAEPAYRCSCPSRKFPCKHALGLLLLWSDGAVDAAQPPEWVAQWSAGRTERKEKAVSRPAKATDPAVTAASVARRAQRVEAGVAELERWLTDQIRQGLAGAARAGYGHWDTMAARLVDAQAPGLASAVRRLAMVAANPERLLAELGLIWLLARAYGRIDQLPDDLAATVRSRVGFPVATELVLAGPRVRDEWAVVGRRDEFDERLTVRRVWLRGATTGRTALVLSFAAAGAPLAADLVPGTAVEADLCFYPGRLPLRALVAQRYGEPRRLDRVDGSATLAQALTGYAEALAAEPWLERWPVVLEHGVLVPGVLVPGAAGRWRVADRDGASLPLDVSTGDPWRLVAAAGGAPSTVVGEYSTAGLRPVSVFTDGLVSL
jgi:hypothetical protein